MKSRLQLVATNLEVIPANAKWDISPETHCTYFDITIFSINLSNISLSESSQMMVVEFHVSFS